MSSSFLFMRACKEDLNRIGTMEQFIESVASSSYLNLIHLNITHSSSTNTIESSENVSSIKEFKYITNNYNIYDVYATLTNVTQQEIVLDKTGDLGFQRPVYTASEDDNFPLLIKREEIWCPMELFIEKFSRLIYI